MQQSNSGNKTLYETITFFINSIFQMFLLNFFKQSDVYFNKLKMYILNFFNKKTNEILMTEKSEKQDDYDYDLKNICHIGNMPENYSLVLKYKRIKDKNLDITFNNDPDTNYFFIKILFSYLIKLNHLSSSVFTRLNAFPQFDNDKTIIEVEKGLFCKIVKLHLSTDSFVPEFCHIELYSKIFTLQEIRQFLYKIKKEYLEDLNNQINNGIYFFEQVNNKTNNDPRGKILPDGSVDKLYLSSLPKNLTFTKKTYTTHRSFDNLIGNNTQKIYSKIKFFQENENWYKSKGIPYHFGMLLSGIPGSGKTSAIKAIANYTKRHIINIHLKNIKTKYQLYNLLTDNNIVIGEGDNKQNLFIPIHKRLYVLEEIDCFGDIVLNRNEKSKEESKEEDNEFLFTLGDLLTILDGNMEYPGRIIVFTSNHPEKLDPALIRGGRIDLSIKYTYSTKDEIIKYLEFYFDTTLTTSQLNLIDTHLTISKISFADLAQNCFSFELNDAIENIINYNSDKLKESKKDCQILNNIECLENLQHPEQQAFNALANSDKLNESKEKGKEHYQILNNNECQKNLEHPEQQTYNALANYEKLTQEEKFQTLQEFNKLWKSKKENAKHDIQFEKNKEIIVSSGNNMSDLVENKFNQSVSEEEFNKTIKLLGSPFN